MSNQQPAHRAPVPPLSELDKLEDILEAGQTGTHRLELVVSPPERAGRVRRLGTTAMDLLLPHWSWDEWKTIGKVMGGTAVAAGLVFLYVEKPAPEEEIVYPQDYYVHMKASHHGDTLASLIERYGFTHNRWTEIHAYGIAEMEVSTSNATTKSHGLYQNLIESPYDELKPGAEVQFAHYLLEKPKP
jgi:hypothetical protein